MTPLVCAIGCGIGSLILCLGSWQNNGLISLKIKEIHNGFANMAAEGEERFCFTESLYMFWNNAAS